VLAKTARLTESVDFARATKSGLRYSTTNFVGYLYPTGEKKPARAGLIISKNVGGSVTRHRIARQIRHVLRETYSQLPEGSLFVVRALHNPQTPNKTKKASNNQEVNALDLAGEVKKIVTQVVKKLLDKAEHK
jgi:ribonuclease P protein component